MGGSCFRASKGRCWFKHSLFKNTTPQQGQGAGQSQGSRPQEARLQGGSLQGDRQVEAGGQGAGQQDADGHGAWQQQGARQSRPRSGNKNRTRLWCSFQDKCLRRESCTYQHFDQGFQINQNQTHQ